MFHNALHKAIANVRERKDLSQKALAVRCGVDGCTVSRWESGERQPQDYHLPVLCEALECSEFELWDEHCRLQQVYYTDQAALAGEPPPIYNTSPIARALETLLRLENDAVPPEFADAMAGMRQALMTLLTLVEPLFTQHVGLHRALAALERERNEPETPTEE